MIEPVTLEIQDLIKEVHITLVPPQEVVDDVEREAAT